MKKHTFKSLFTTMLLLSILAQFGCEKKTEKIEQPKDGIQTEQTAPDTVSEIKEPVAEENITIPDIKGTWTGTLNKRETTLTITEQDSISFRGSITINYRDVINQQVSGKVNPDDNTFTMNDLLKHRFAGSYSGKISEDLNTLDGTFLQKAEKKTFPFNLKRKQ